MFIKSTQLALIRNRKYQSPRPRPSKDAARNQVPSGAPFATQNRSDLSQGRGSVEERLFWKQEGGSSILLVPTTLLSSGNSKKGK